MSLELKALTLKSSSASRVAWSLSCPLTRLSSSSASPRASGWPGFGGTRTGEEAEEPAENCGHGRNQEVQVSSGDVFWGSTMKAHPRPRDLPEAEGLCQRQAKLDAGTSLTRRIVRALQRGSIPAMPSCYGNLAGRSRLARRTKAHQRAGA